MSEKNEKMRLILILNFHDSHEIIPSRICLQFSAGKAARIPLSEHSKLSVYVLYNLKPETSYPYTVPKQELCF